MQTLRLRRTLLSASALLLAFMSPATVGAQGSNASVPAAQPPGHAVATLTVSALLTGSTYRLNGHVEAVRQATLAAQVGGNVLSFTAKAGDRVKAGQVLARIDERSAEAGVRVSAAAVDQAEALLQSAKLHAERTQALRQQGFVSSAAVDEAQVRLRAAEAGLDQARAGRSQASLQQGFASIRAPFDGVVLATHVELGDLATPGRPLMTVYAPGRLRAVVDVPSSRAGAARAAGQWEVMGADGKRWTPSSRTELPSADPVAQTTEWRLELPPEAAASLGPGANVDVQFTTASGSPALTTPGASGNTAAMPRPRIPVQAVLLRGELTAVYAVFDGRFVLRPIRIAGSLGGTDVEVVAGLRPGDLIAADAVKAGLAGAVPAR